MIDRHHRPGPSPASAVSTLTLTVAPLLLSSIGLLAAIVAARRVLRNDPAVPLRSD